VEHLVIVRAEAPDRFTAQALGLPEVKGEGPTAAAAVEQVRARLSDWLEGAKLVRVQVPGNGARNPWLDSFGRSANDPQFDAYLEELQRARSRKP
jgi:hypothetical protein